MKLQVEAYVPGGVTVAVERIMNAQTTESENTETHVFSVYISIASVKENRARLSAQLRIRSASAAYTAFSLIIKPSTSSHPCSDKRK